MVLGWIGKLLDSNEKQVRKLRLKVDQINEEIVSCRCYQALKLTQELIDYEQEVVRRVQ